MATYGPYNLEDLADNEVIDVLIVDDNFKRLSSGTTQLDASGTPTTEAMGDAPARGSGTTAAHADHKHGMPAFGTTPTTQAFGDAANGGASADVSRADHRHGMPSSVESVTYGRKTVQAGDLVGGVYVVPANISWVFCAVACTVQLPAPSTARPIYVAAITGTALITATGGSTVYGGSYNTTTGAQLSPTQLSQGDSTWYVSDGSNWRN